RLRRRLNCKPNRNRPRPWIRTCRNRRTSRTQDSLLELICKLNTALREGDRRSASAVALRACSAAAKSVKMSPVSPHVSPDLAHADTLRMKRMSLAPRSSLSLRVSCPRLALLLLAALVGAACAPVRAQTGSAARPRKLPQPEHIIADYLKTVGGKQRQRALQ